eukprot:jgi/Chlat1/2321/Chrsp17S02605
MQNGPSGTGLSPVEEQSRYVTEALQNVKQQAYYMKKALDDSNLRDALKYASSMLGELRTSLLSPQKYFELYMRTFDELRYLEAFFSDEQKRGRAMSELYELVQHAGNILPRLYLMTTVGSVYIKSKQAPAKEVLRDLVEMTRGVQHPIRGLFLRSYLSQISKDKLPDVGTEYEGEGGTVHDAVDFVLQNFTEMNKLWVRMQHQASARERQKREKERSELRDLVGKNLLVLSQLDGVDLELYQSTVLPRILEQVVNCKDEIAQYYLMDCVIQVFPDDYHLQTLDVLLDACSQLQPGVDVRTVISQLMQRLASYAERTPEILAVFEQVNSFGKLSSAAAKVVEAYPDMTLVDAIGLHVALLKFVLRVHKNRLDFVNDVLASCCSVLAGKGRIAEARAAKQALAMLTTPLEAYQDITDVLNLSNYPKLMGHLDHQNHTEMATTLVNAVIKHQTIIRNPDMVDKLLGFIAPLVKTLEGAPSESERDKEEFEDEQNLVARLVHNLYADAPETMFEILSNMRRHFSQGGSTRTPHTFSSITFSALRFIRSVKLKEAEQQETGVSLKKIFQFLYQVVQSVADAGNPEQALRLNLLCAQAASDSDFELLAYEFFTQAFVLYEEEVSDTRAQLTALHLMIGTLQTCYVFGPDERGTLVHKATAYSARLLRKPDQCRAILACSHLFWSDHPKGVKDGDSVLACLKRSLKIANAAQQLYNDASGGAGPVFLFVEILNKYLYYFDKGTPAITPTVLQGLLELIRTELNGEQEKDASITNFYRSTLQHIAAQKKKGGEVGERYASVNIELH